MRIIEVEKNLNTALVKLTEVKEVTSALVDAARLLINESDIHQLQETAVAIAATTATIENSLNAFARIGVKGKRFAALRK